METRHGPGDRAREQKDLARVASCLPSTSSRATNPRLHQNRKLICSPTLNNAAVLYRCRYRLLFSGSEFSPADQTHTTPHKPKVPLPHPPLPLLFHFHNPQPNSSPHNPNFPPTIAIPISLILGVGFRLPAVNTLAYSVCGPQSCIPTPNFLPLHRCSAPFAPLQLPHHITTPGVMPYPKPISEPIAVVGASCRFAGGVNTPSRLWQLLANPSDLTQEVPADRFNIDVSPIPRVAL